MDTGYLQPLTDWLSNNNWIVQVFVVVFLVLLFNLVLRGLIRRLHRKLQATSNPWDDAVVAALQRPLGLLVWIVGIAFAAEIAGKETGAVILDAVIPVRPVLPLKFSRQAETVVSPPDFRKEIY